MIEDRENARRRLHPRIWDTDWLMLRGMAHVIHRIVVERVDPEHRVLDFGCGDAPYRALITARGASYHGADFDPGSELVIAADGSLTAQTASFDCVLSIQVLEHVRDLQTYFAEIARVLKPNGELILSTHGTWLYHPHPEDHWRWTRTGLKIEIERHGFIVREMHSIVGPLATTTMVRLTGFSFFLKRIPLIGDLLSGMLAVIMNVRGLIEDAITPTTISADNGSVYLTLCEPAQK
jgi:SAM-dependent methyltransferase